MNIESISGAATVALASTLVFIVITRSWQLFARNIQSASIFSRGMMREAAQRFRDELDRLTDSQSVYFSAVLVFAVLFFAAYELDADRLFLGYPRWQLHIFLATLAAGAALTAWRLACTVLARQRVRLYRDANIAIGHQLHKIASDFGRVFHDVTTEAGLIDHVIVGTSGAYAISVFARRPDGNGSVTLTTNTLDFGATGKTASTVDIAARAAALEREFRRLLDHRVRVRSVIAVPGWDVASDCTEDHLVVNEQSLPMLKGWKQPSDHLLDEDVEALHRMLTGLCSLADA